MIHPLILLISILLLSACSPFAPDITNENEPNEEFTSQSVIQEEEDPDEHTEEPGHAGTEIQSVVQFELDLILDEEDDWHFFYELEPDGFKATVEGAQPDQVDGDDAFTEVEALLTRLSVTTEHSITGIVRGVTSALNTDMRDIESFSLVLVTTQEERFEFAFQDLSSEDRLEDASAFHFENRLYSGETMLMTHGESEPSTVEEPNGDALRGAQADEFIRQYLADMAFGYDMPLRELKHAMLTPLNIESDEVADFTLEASFTDGHLRFRHLY